MAVDQDDAAGRLARIDRMIEEYREAKKRQVLRRAKKLWRRAESDQQLAELERPPTLIH
jgi:hypothetical protein